MRGLALVAVAAAFALISRAQTTGDFDPHDLSGHWNRTSRFQTFSNVWSGQGPRQGVEEAPFTEAGKARFDKNKPGYGPRAVPPAIGNDPMGTCDPLGIPRLLNTEVISPHQTMEIVQVAGRMIQFFEWHHDWRGDLQRTVARCRSRTMWIPPGTAPRSAAGMATCSW